MRNDTSDLLDVRRLPSLSNGTLVLAFTGWMDGGDVSTGTVKRLVDLLGAEKVAEVDCDPFYLFSFPGSMEVAALFRPEVSIADGLVQSIALPTNTFYADEKNNLLLFVGREPNLRWPTFADCIMDFACKAGVTRVLFVGSFGGPIPHTREPRLYVTCSDAKILPEMQQFAMKRTGYTGPSSFSGYLLTRAPEAGLEMTSLVAEIPGYLQGRNPMSIEAVTRRLAKILRVPLDLRTLRAESTRWELEVSQAIEKDEDLAGTVRKLEDAYDDALLNAEGENGPDEEPLTVE